MNFIRPELRTHLWTWREVLAGVGMCAVGVWLWFAAGGLLGWVGGAIALAGVAQGIVGVQKVRFRSNGQGPGVVQVIEGQIMYFGPLGGGAVSVSDLDSLVLNPSGKPAHWVLEQTGVPILHIPVNAKGSEALFDAFATLPGIRTERMLSELQAGSAHSVVIWSRQSIRPTHQRLH